MRDNLEQAFHCLLKAKELAPNNVEIIHDLEYVTSSFYQQQTSSPQRTQDDSTEPFKNLNEETSKFNNIMLTENALL